jgi:pSer/pThr/pTyr-binding forkhead associated (FHA) protein
MMAHGLQALRLEVVEGPDKGRVVTLDDAIVIGRGADADLTLDDPRASRRHARVRRSGSGALVEDLGSRNGTFVNDDQVESPTVVTAGDELLVGVTVLELRDEAQVRAAPSAVRAVPPALLAAERRPTYVDEVARAQRDADEPRSPELERLVDRRTKQQARTAPLALLVLVALAVVLYFGLR